MGGNALELSDGRGAGETVLAVSPECVRILGHRASAFPTRERMIAVELQGRFGNQMFQYAFALEAARRLSTDFVICGSTSTDLHDEQLSKHFTLGERGLPSLADPPYPVLRIGHHDYDRPEDILVSLTDSTRYKGFFQSHGFFAGAEDEVRKTLQIRPEHDEAFREHYTDLLGKPYICCHVRRTDYLSFVGGVALPLSYYHESLARVSRPRGTPVVFVGDDLEEVRQEFASLDGVRFEQNELIVDFQLILHARTAVVSNSTFAWWGAWLGDRGRRVIAPEHWLNWNHRFGWYQQREAGDSSRTKRSWEYPRAIIPARWSQVPIRRSWRERIAPWSIKSSLALLANNVRAAVARI